MFSSLAMTKIHGSPNIFVFEMHFSLNDAFKELCRRENFEIGLYIVSNTNFITAFENR